MLVFFLRLASCGRGRALSYPLSSLLRILPKVCWEGWARISSEVLDDFYGKTKREVGTVSNRSISLQYVQGTPKRSFPGLVSFVPAFAYHFCLNSQLA